MATTKSSGISAGTYTTLALLLEAPLRINTVVRLITGERFSVDATDLGSGTSLTLGGFINPIETPQTQTNADAIFPVNIATATNLVVGKNYLSTATATHTVPAAGNEGDEIIITWEDGTVMTLTSSSNISVTKNVKVTDTTWVFTNFISVLTLVDNGTEWEIK